MGLIKPIKIDTSGGVTAAEIQSMIDAQTTSLNSKIESSGGGDYVIVTDEGIVKTIITQDTQLTSSVKTLLTFTPNMSGTIKIVFTIYSNKTSTYTKLTCNDGSNNVDIGIAYEVYNEAIVREYNLTVTKGKTYKITGSSSDKGYCNNLAIKYQVVAGIDPISI